MRKSVLSMVLLTAFFHLLDLPLPGLVHVNVSARTLQQLLLCRSSSGHRHGCQNPAHHPVLCYSQRQTGLRTSSIMMHHEASCTPVFPLGTVNWPCTNHLFLAADDDSGFAGCSGVPLHSGGLQLLPQVLQQEWGWGWTRHEVWWHDDCKCKANTWL